MFLGEREEGKEGVENLITYLIIVHIQYMI